jgi:hypothetical protein
MFGPLTYAEMYSKTYGYPTLSAPDGGWDREPWKKPVSVPVLEQLAQTFEALGAS